MADRPQRHTSLPSGLLLSGGLFLFYLLFSHGLQAQVQSDSVIVPADTALVQGDTTQISPDTSSSRPSKSEIASPPIGTPFNTATEDTLLSGNTFIFTDTVQSIVRIDNDSSLSRRKRRIARLEMADPKVALRRSLILPGWGQLYNRARWYKYPIIYGGFVGLGYMFGFNQRQYRYHRDAAICIGDTTCTGFPEFNGFTQANVISIRDDHRRFRDLSVILGALWYLLQGVDAYVEAHLQPFDVGDDLTLRVKPAWGPEPFQRRSVYLGASITLGFR